MHNVLNSEWILKNIKRHFSNLCSVIFYVNNRKWWDKFPCGFAHRSALKIHKKLKQIHFEFQIHSSKCSSSWENIYNNKNVKNKILTCSLASGPTFHQICSYVFFVIEWTLTNWAEDMICLAEIVSNTNNIGCPTDSSFQMGFRPGS